MKFGITPTPAKSLRASLVIPAGFERGSAGDLQRLPGPRAEQPVPGVPV